MSVRHHIKKLEQRNNELQRRVDEAEARLKVIDDAIAGQCRRNGFAPFGDTFIDIATLGIACERAIELACRLGAPRIQRTDVDEEEKPQLRLIDVIDWVDPDAPPADHVSVITSVTWDDKEPKDG